MMYKFEQDVAEGMNTLMFKLQIIGMKHWFTEKVLQH